MKQVVKMVTVTINATARNDVANVPVFTPATKNQKRTEQQKLPKRKVLENVIVSIAIDDYKSTSES